MRLSQSAILFYIFYSTNFVFYSMAFSDIDRSGNSKEWTFLVYLNGNNSLDSYSQLNLKQMEQVGSTQDINIVVQWASLANNSTQRLYITKGNDPNRVTSPVIQNLRNRVDMGDWKSLVDFVKWGVTHYPAKHYFIDVWDHGSGWHALHALSNPLSLRLRPMDISWDDHTQHSITTPQLGQALSEAARMIGHKIDLYGSDACLMAMVEIADEVNDSVSFFAGSEEVEPGEGWPYHTLLQRWAANPKITGAEVGAILTEEYVKSHKEGENGTQEATFSVFDLNKMTALNQEISKFGQALLKLLPESRTKIMEIAKTTQNFSYRDYGDLTDFLEQLETAQVQDLDPTLFESLKNILNQFVIAHDSTPTYKRAFGASIWLPTSIKAYRSYSEQYKSTKFESHTQWGETLASLLQ